MKINSNMIRYILLQLQVGIKSSDIGFVPNSFDSIPKFEIRLIQEVTSNSKFLWFDSTSNLCQCHQLFFKLSSKLQTLNYKAFCKVLIAKLAFLYAYFAPLFGRKTTDTPRSIMTGKFFILKGSNHLFCRERGWMVVVE